MIDNNEILSGCLLLVQMDVTPTFCDQTSFEIFQYHNIFFWYNYERVGSNISSVLINIFHDNNYVITFLLIRNPHFSPAHW